ncbi:hypothetical protein CA839_12260 [Fusobacterium polymorphum]|uniref:Uncharacterized protein n=1 Tax=Fusobacterium nucleatum subsp. polymorphum TaxID=76857 RepID=A0A246ECX4_FUSNP|nr:hypothetical protein [Fusobacterium polymorphum]OWP23734.1 hypothetical protein CA839_12260 [Fusobacterium polymorphum]
MSVHRLTQEKIDSIKKKIQDKIDLKEIIITNFGNSKHRFNEWLSKYSSHFTGAELDYLKFVIIADEEVKKANEMEVIEEIEEKNTILTVPVPNLTQISMMSRKDRENFLLSNQVIEKLVNLLNSEDIKDTNIVIRDEARNLKDLKIQNIRISEEIYKDFVSICKKHNLTITSVINSMFLDFISQHK